MYHFDLLEDIIIINNIDALSDKALNRLDFAIQKTNLKRSYNLITGTQYDFYKFLQIMSDLSYCLI